jgi:glycosyltransferase involved in cell wall biosynthesis
MKILLATHAFSPSFGGIETCSLDLALAFSKFGHEVQVMTPTHSNTPLDDHGLKVIRNPANAAVLRAIRWCDIYFQNNISLQTAWPLVFIRKPWVVCTHTWLPKNRGRSGLVGRLKIQALRFATNVYISKAVRDHVGYAGYIIPNPYNRDVFRPISGIPRRQSLVFVGRLVPDKGCDLLIQSLTNLRAAGLSLPLTIIGAGPEESKLKSLVATNGLEPLVRFAGVLRGEELAKELNRHLVLVVPSRWEEPFGLVALEGAACGCLVVGSAEGGLSDAIGQCGITFKNGDVNDLTRALRAIIETPQLQADCRQAGPDHLYNHRAETVAERYLEVFQKVIE